MGGAVVTITKNMHQMHSFNLDLLAFFEMCQTFQSIVLLLEEAISIIANGQIGRLTLGAKKVPLHGRKMRFTHCS
jgi:hypothetical protein